LHRSKKHALQDPSGFAAVRIAALT